MFEILTQKLGSIFSSLGNKGRLSEKEIDDALRQIRLALLEADVNFKVVKSFLADVREKALDTKILESLTPVHQIVKIVNEELINVLGKEVSHLKAAAHPPSIVMLVGLQGAGKTTTAAKLAANLKQSNHMVLLVAADTRRPAAIDQLKVLGQQLDIPVYSEDIKSDPVKICNNAVKKADDLAATWVIIDTQGRLHIDEILMHELVAIKNKVKPTEILLVADSMTGQDAVMISEEFNKSLGLTGLILTKLDGDARGGAALSIRAVTGIPIKFIGVGEKASALEAFYPDRLASRILGMGDVLTLIEKAEKTFDKKQMEQLESKIRKSEFDLEDLLWQLRQIKKMGSFGQLVEMIPGFSKITKGVSEKESLDRTRRVEAIILSMTSEERRNPEIINGSRKRRIARGSGTSPNDINQLLNQFYSIQKMTKMIAKGKMPRNFTDMIGR
ncbi:MAG: signal recognition particle protein [Dehalococcoidia bacterium]|nr:signal recognition particle protein [Dehalococcoidia bacterium]MDD5493369.1 signal recognition particle protein [Dehalococcoidia bacterium]